MTHRLYLRATAFAASAFVLSFAAIALTDPLPRVIWNASASAPLGLYRIRPDSDPPVGALVAVAPPERLGRWMAGRGYLGRGVLLLKHVTAKTGQRVCRMGVTVSVDGRVVAIALVRDRIGRPLPAWQGCRTLAAGELLLLNPDHPDSLDGRYFGPLPASTVLGRAIPILTRDAPEAPLTWRAARP
ncbi:conjugative transfer signal peptidase TraF [Sphingobium wenxiniae]|jgi:conjugative transfer signal peptidase TraF|uniref:Conjugative transfer signal peptidase TraF n=1 Tax=Sphingobium wenxiniae (strain DSM 21828 / CGMCC 1.7748 / JZ-1) TaxID=595605 RepID=A0A562K9R2_SPHWJ|nr:S26 family signal peptidase [Sphingobium wenxiniae]MBB6192352.1 conjugative transfer signal peptidase TraF [Sphingobium wenxiniae]TWH91955.1 conjugative transfer signal peptidase TraF [Sphingobium wenxiniae]